MSPAAELAAALHSTITDHMGDVRINVGSGSFIYCSVRGLVRLQRYGKPVVTLGQWSDGTDALARAYRREVAA